MARIAVTGATGMLGCTLLPRLRGSRHEVVGLARGAGADLRVDVTDSQAVREALRETRPDAVIHLAALTDVDACERDPQQAFMLNVRSVENVRDACRDVGACLVHVSTDHVYDGPGAHAESDVTIVNHYAMSKYAGELAAGGGATVLRTNFFGRSLCPRRPSFSDWIAEALRAGRTQPVFGDVTFSPLRMRTLVSVIDRVVAAPVPGIFNAGAGTAMSKADFAFAVAAALGLDAAPLRRAKVASIGLGTRRPACMAMDSSRLCGTFGILLPTLEEEIAALRQEYANEL
jgi:dTDP-4-dehydrorhamnose reductase